MSKKNPLSGIGKKYDVTHIIARDLGTNVLLVYFCFDICYVKLTIPILIFGTGEKVGNYSNSGRNEYYIYYMR